MTPHIEPVDRVRVTDRFTKGTPASWSARLGKLIRFVLLLGVVLAGLAIGYVLVGGSLA